MEGNFLFAHSLTTWFSNALIGTFPASWKNNTLVGLKSCPLHFNTPPPQYLVTDFMSFLSVKVAFLIVITSRRVRAVKTDPPHVTFAKESCCTTTSQIYPNSGFGISPSPIHSLTYSLPKTPYICRRTWTPLPRWPFAIETQTFLKDPAVVCC